MPVFSSSAVPTAVRRRALRTAVLAAALLPAGAAGAVQDAAPPTAPTGPVFEIETLAPGVHAALVVPEPDAYAFANSLVVVGDDGVLVVDTQQSPRAARALIAHIRELTDLPVRWVVNTHWHGDHVYGNAAYREAWPDVAFLATPATVDGMRGPGAEMRADELASLPASIQDRRDWLDAGELPDGRALTPEIRRQIEYSLRMRTLYLEELEDLEVVEPERLVEDRRRIDLGRLDVVLWPVGSAHTAGDLVVSVPQAGVVAVGDLLEEAPPWIEGADLIGWAYALEAVQALEPEVVLPAHGAVGRDRALLDAEAALFLDLVDAARAEADAPTRDAVEAMAERLEPHRAFFRQLGASDARFEQWVADASRQALEQVRDEGR